MAVDWITYFVTPVWCPWIGSLTSWHTCGVRGLDHGWVRKNSSSFNPANHNRRLNGGNKPSQSCERKVTIGMQRNEPNSLLNASSVSVHLLHMGLKGRSDIHVVGGSPTSPWWLPRLIGDLGGGGVASGGGGVIWFAKCVGWILVRKVNECDLTQLGVNHSLSMSE